MVKVIETFTVTVVRMGKGRKPVTDTISLRRVRRNVDPPARTIEEMLAIVLDRSKPPRLSSGRKRSKK